MVAETRLRYKQHKIYSKTNKMVKVTSGSYIIIHSSINGRERERGGEKKIAVATSLNHTCKRKGMESFIHQQKDPDEGCRLCTGTEAVQERVEERGLRIGEGRMIILLIPYLSISLSVAFAL